MASERHEVISLLYFKSRYFFLAVFFLLGHQKTLKDMHSFNKEYKEIPWPGIQPTAGGCH